eukprot:TRINITY_DN17951_c0_g1_i3.p1 TRINITY_DN17951_c0_g1~~TRINITY_DN17951_c0_g1_i3.p1  ORF type:complete len:519 (+),score=43.63 TRINITY_DN17951_c0_g1_i3:335-1891(+)
MNEGKGEESTSSKTDHLFPVFVNELFCKKYGLKSLVEQICWDLVCNLQEYRKSYQEVEIFGCWLDEHYDPEDLLFFLYVRNVIQEHHTKLAKHYPEGLPAGMSKKLTDRMCMSVVRTVFGEDPDMLRDDFLGAIDEHLVYERGNRERVMSVHTFLALTVEEYHNTRPQDEISRPAQHEHLSPHEHFPPAEIASTVSEQEARQKDEWSQRINQLEAARHLAMQEQQEECMDEDQQLASRILDAMKANGFKSSRLESRPRSRARSQELTSDSESTHSHNASPIPPKFPAQSPPDLFSFSVSPTSTEGPQTPHEVSSKNHQSPLSINQVNLQLIMELKACMVEDTQRYLDVIMSAADNLPESAQEEIHAVVEGRLQAKVASGLSKVLEASEEKRTLQPQDLDEPATAALQHEVNEIIVQMVDSAVEACQGPISALSDFEVPQPTPGALEVSNVYHNLLISQLRRLSDQSSSTCAEARHNALCTFSRTLLGSPDLRQEIEPLIAFLVIFATKQIEATDQYDC